MPKYSVGQRLRSAVSSVAVVVVRPPDGEPTITCAGTPMLLPDQQPDESAAPPIPAEPPQILLGKRYRDEGGSDLELLCVAAGPGDLAVDGRVLTIKTAKPLPASD